MVSWQTVIRKEKEKYNELYRKNEWSGTSEAIPFHLKATGTKDLEIMTAFSCKEHFVNEKDTFTLSPEEECFKARLVFSHMSFRASNSFSSSWREGHHCHWQIFQDFILYSSCAFFSYGPLCLVWSDRSPKNNNWAAVYMKKSSLGFPWHPLLRIV